MTNSVDPDQTAPIGTVCSGSTLFASILNLSVMLGNHLQQTTSADDIFRCIFFLGALRVKTENQLLSFKTFKNQLTLCKMNAIILLCCYNRGKCTKYETSVHEPRHVISNKVAF